MDESEIQKKLEIYIWSQAMFKMYLNPWNRWDLQKSE